MLKGTLPMTNLTRQADDTYLCPKHLYAEHAWQIGHQKPAPPGEPRTAQWIVEALVSHRP